MNVVYSLMDEAFELPVELNGKEVLFDCRFAKFGYSYRIYVQIGKQEVIFEPDEERNFRAIVEAQAAKPIEHSLVAAIAAALEKAFR